MLHLDLDDLRKIVSRQLVEDDRFVDAVQQLRPKGFLEHVADVGFDFDIDRA